VKRLLVLYIFFCCCFQINASTYPKLVANGNAGKLSSNFIKYEKDNITDLTVSGFLDYNDFIFIRDSLPKLVILDISATKIQKYGEPYLEDCLPDYSFYDIKNGVGKHTLETVMLPQSLISIGKYAFLDCSSMIKVIVPETVKKIGTGAFQNCISLTTTNLPKSLQTNDEDYYLSEGVFSSCVKLNTITIPDSITVIPQKYFERCVSLTSISIPSNITLIYSEAFKDCIGLQSIYLNSYYPIDISNPEVSANVFKNVNIKSCILYVPNGSKYLYQKAKQWKDFSNIVEIGSGLFKTVKCYAGGLSALLNETEKFYLENIIITDTIDARDFVILRDSLPNLTVLDISNAKIKAYKGSLGTAGSIQYTYANNEIPVNAFYDASYNLGKHSLTNIILPSTSTSIAQNAFTACTSIHSIIFPSSVTNIGIYAFGECSNLTSIAVPQTVKTIADSAFAKCTKLSSFTIPTSDTILKRQLFSGNTSLTSIVIPSNVENIETLVFYNCTALSSIYMYKSIPIELSKTSGTITSDVFKNVDKNTCTLYVPYGTKGNYSVANQWSDFLNIVEMLPNTINCTPGNLTKLLNKIQKDTITHLTLSGIIDASDFATMRDNMPQLTNLDISSVSIAAYYGSNGTHPADISSTITDKYYDENAIPQEAFFNPTIPTYNSKLSAINLPTEITKIDINAFEKTKISSITIPPKVSYLSGFNQTEISSINIPASVTEIGDQAFSYTKLTSISFPPNLTIIDQFAFNGSKLKILSVPSTVTTIGNNAFASCNDLTSVTLSDSVSTIMPMAFSGDTSLMSINIPSKLTHIPQNFLQECRNLQSIYIPNTVTSIGGYAFDNCKKLKSIYVNTIIPIDLSTNPLKPPSPYVFENIDKSTCILYVPFGAKVEYKKASQWKDFTNIVEIKDVYFNHSIVTLFEGESIGLKNSVITTNNLPFIFKMKDESIASISNEGLLKSNKIGNTKIYLIKPMTNLIYDSTFVVVLPNITITNVAIFGSRLQIELTLDKDFPFYDKMENDFSISILGSTETVKVLSILKDENRGNVLFLQLNKQLPLNKTMTFAYSTANVETGVTSLKTSFTIVSTKIEDSKAEAINIYPNPTKNDLTVKMKSIQTISLYTIEGHLVLMQDINGDSAQLSLENIPNGLYTIQIKTNNSVINKMIVKL